MKPFLVKQLNSALSGKKVLLGVSGSIAAFKACDLVRALRECGAEVRCVLTSSAMQFVTPTTLETLSGQSVGTSLWGQSGTHHIEWARWADVAIVAPATANTISKLAWGVADDLLLTEFLAFTGPQLVAPAMNPVMFNDPSVQANLRTLLDRGVKIVGPATGVMACGEEGFGRLEEVETILEAVAEIFYKPSLGLRALLDMGPTRSYLDPVRYITNRSSGKMGAAMAWALARQGFEVKVVTSVTDYPLPRSATVTNVTTSDEMAEGVLGEWPNADLFVGTAAVLDFQFRETFTQKLKKDQGVPTLDLVPTRDILKEIGATRKPGQFVLGFAAETSNFLEVGRDKKSRKNCDAVFVNDISQADRGFGADQNSGLWIGREEREIGHSGKENVAQELVRLVLLEWSR